MRNRQSKIRLTFYSVFLGCGENIDPQREVTEETLTPENEAKAEKVQVKKKWTDECILSVSRFIVNVV